MASLGFFGLGSMGGDRKVCEEVTRILQDIGPTVNHGELSHDSGAIDGLGMRFIGPDIPGVTCLVESN